MGIIFRFIIILTGAFFFWTIKGFKGKFNDEMTGRFDTSFKDVRNFIAGLLILCMIAFLIFNIV
ncbi:MAG: hypothetical protein HXX18_07330 [Bacteroidetes bacterium]|nr:hypothetical protein [Bacteroidota bacterium]